MPKDVLVSVHEPHLVDEFRADQLGYFDVLHQVGKQFGVEAQSDDRRGVQRMFSRRADAVDACSNGRLQ
jgi:hypothetical protein